MTLLKLSPESERLRRIAKAHAAGELSKGEYRRIRADVIESFGTGCVPDTGDDTEPRWEPRLVQTEPAPGKRRRHGYWLAMVLAGVLTLLCLVSMRGWAASIGPAAERDPNPATSPRFPVTSVVVDNADDLRSLGLSGEALQTFLADGLARISGEGQPAAHGFTEGELAELGTLLSSMGVHRTGAELNERDAQEILALIREQKSRRGVSLVQLERLAAELTEFCRARGVPLAVAYVPVQDVVDGRVAFHVLPGRLDDLRISGTADYPRQLLEEAFAAQRGQVVQREGVESAVYLINDLPGIETQATFVEGETVGGTDLELKVQTTRRWDLALRLDNHGDDATDEVRAILEAGWLNPSGRGDALTAGLLTSPDPDDSLYGYLNYDLPLGGVRTRLGAGVSRHDYRWQRGVLSVDGDATTVAGEVTHALVRGRRANFSLVGGVAYQHLEQDAAGVTLKDQDLIVGTLGGRARHVFDRTRWVLDGELAGNLVAVADGEVAGQDSTTLRLRFDGGAWRPLSIPGLERDQRLRLRLSGQVATGALPGTYQVGLGGVGAVRGFEPSILSVDDGVVGSVEAHLAPWQARYGTMVLFGDAAYGEQRRTFGGDVWGQLSAVGVGWDWSYGDRVDARLRWAYPLQSRGSNAADWIEEDGSQVWLLVRVRPWDG